MGSEEWLKKTGVDKLIEADKAAAEAEEKFNSDMVKAIANLASGGIGEKKEETENDS